jgi:hypothetical protein
MKIVKGWRRMDNERGFMNETTGQTPIVTKKQFSERFVVLLFPRVKNDDEGTKISPEYATEAKAIAFAIDWMSRNPKGSNGLWREQHKFAFWGLVKSHKNETRKNSLSVFPNVVRALVPAVRATLEKAVFAF